MRNVFLRLYVRAQIVRNALKDESGQDLIEYVLVATLLALAAITSITGLASTVNSGFSVLETNLSSALVAA